MRDIKSTLASVRKKFSDNFSSRSDTTGGLGTATDGSQWTAINGSIAVTTGKAKATAPAEGAAGTAYPIATVKMPTANNIIEIKDAGQGSAAALWVQSSTDWWMVDIDSTFNSIPGNTVYGVVGSNYITTGANYGQGNAAYGVVALNYATDGGSNYGLVNFNYTTTVSGYGATGTNYNASTNYGATGSNYSTGTSWNSGSQTTYGTGSTTNYRSAVVSKVTNYFATTTYNTNSWTGTFYSQQTNYSVSGTNYGATGTTYGVGSTNYGATSWSNQISGGNYQKTGSNYMTTGSNYGLDGNYNYKAISNNYSTDTANYGSTGTNATTYAYAQYLRIKQSSAGIVSTITSALISASQTANSLRLQLVGNQITAKAFSDANLVTQIGSDLVYTATGATVVTNFGIAISPSAYQQSDIIGSSINITRS